MIITSNFKALHVIAPVFIPCLFIADPWLDFLDDAIDYILLYFQISECTIFSNRQFTSDQRLSVAHSWLRLGERETHWSWRQSWWSNWRYVQWSVSSLKPVQQYLEQIRTWRDEVSTKYGSVVDADHWILNFKLVRVIYVWCEVLIEMNDAMKCNQR